MKRHLGDRFPTYSVASERLRLLEDRAGTGKADHATTFAENFKTPLDGIGAGVLARKGSVWYANIPNLWLLRDTNGDGVADFRKSLHYGFGVRVGFLGHDLHGVHFGPDGRIYFSIGDRGSNVKVADGRMVGEPDMGCVFRCDPDGSGLEVFSFGLRNPQDLVFDQYGNLFTGDNNSDSGDEARWVYLVEGADNGWRVGYQFMENPYSRGPFNQEKLWYPHFEGQAAYIVPPIANIASGPSGVAYFPGTGLPARFKDHFFLVDFRGGPANSGIHSFTLKPQGAGFELVDPQHLIWGVLATDVKFGVDGGIYLSDWVEGWGLTGKGRIYRVHDPAVDRQELVLETKRLLAEGMEKRPLKELAHLMAHADMRVRQEAQFELADRDLPALGTLAGVARQDANQLARLHAIWGLGQVLRRTRPPSSPAELARARDLLIKLLGDPDPEVRAQAAKITGETPLANGFEGLLKLLKDQSPRVRFFAAMSLGKLGRPDALPAVISLLRENADKDPWLRHAGVMALTSIGDMDFLLASARDDSPAVRMGVLLAMRRLHRAELALFLKDPDPKIVLEAARAVNDEPINGALPELAALIGKLNPDASGGNQPEKSSTQESEPLLRRVLNANFHFGTAETARSLAAFASRSTAPENMRIEALAELADWEHPSGRDRVIGLWRPVAAVRPRQTAVEALEPALAAIVHTAPDKVRLAAVHAAARLSISNAAPVLVEMVGDARQPAEVRVEALKTLAVLNDARLEEVVRAAKTDSNEELRTTAMQLETTLKPSSAPASLKAALEQGGAGEKRAALAALAALPAGPADEILAEWLDKLQSGSVPRELQLDLLNAAGKRSALPVKQKLANYEASKSKEDPLAPFRETLFGGNAGQGKKLFFERPEAQCVRCHKINGLGGDVGPDLSHIGAQKEREYLLESIVLPNKQIAPGFDSVMVTMKNDDSFAGVLKSETPTELVLNTPQTGLVTVKKSDIQSRQKALSPMPEGMAQILSKQDLRDLVEFLSNQK